MKFLLLLVVVGLAAAGEDNVYYLEDFCKRAPEILLSPVDGPHFATIRLKRPDSPITEECKVNLLFKTSSKYTLMLTVGNIHLTDREDSGLCFRHFIQFDGLQTETLTRLCQRGEPLRYNQAVLSKTWEFDIFYYRRADLAEQHDVNIRVAAIARANNTNECPSVPHPETKSLTQMFRCHSDTICLPTAYRCDKIANCEDGSDELDCPSGTTVPTVVSSSSASVDSSKLASSVDSSSSKVKTHHVVVGVTGGLIIICLVAVIAFFIVRRVNGNRQQAERVSTHVPEEDRDYAPKPSKEEIPLDTRERTDNGVVV